jgi:hypothetical protein
MEAGVAEAATSGTADAGMPVAIPEAGWISADLEQPVKKTRNSTPVRKELAFIVYQYYHKDLVRFRDASLRSIWSPVPRGEPSRCCIARAKETKTGISASLAAFF